MTPLLGHDAQIRAMSDALAGDRMHHGWILSGPRGVGKARFARALATRILADAAGPASTGAGFDVDPEHRIAKLIAAGSHPDFADIHRLVRESDGQVARNITVDQMRSLRRLLTMRPSLSDRRIILIDAADDLERGAANALLKNLEEPPENTFFLLISHATGRLLPTIRSRCRTLGFKPLGEGDMRAVLRAEAPDASEAEIAALLRAGKGSPGRALSFAGLNIAELETALDAIATTGDPDNALRLALAKKLNGKAARPRYEAFLERVPAYLAAQARGREGPALQRAIESWEAATGLVGSAVFLNLDPVTTVVSLCGMAAALAPERTAA